MILVWFPMNLHLNQPREERDLPVQPTTFHLGFNASDFDASSLSMWHVAPYWQNPSNPWNLLGSRANCAIKDRWASTVKSKVPAFKEAHITAPANAVFAESWDHYITIILRHTPQWIADTLYAEREMHKIWRCESLTSLWLQYQHYYRTFEEMVHMCPQCSQASAGLSLACLQREWAS